MSTFDTTGIGSVHHDLCTVAVELAKDGRDSLADEYEERGSTEQRIYADAKRIGDEAKRQRAIVNDDLHVGVELIAFLVRQGWTPPAHFAGRITE